MTAAPGPPSSTLGGRPSRRHARPQPSSVHAGSAISARTSALTRIHWVNPTAGS